MHVPKYKCNANVDIIKENNKPLPSIAQGRVTELGAMCPFLNITFGHEWVRISL